MPVVHLALTSLDGAWVSVHASGGFGELTSPNPLRVPDLSTTIGRLYERSITEQQLYSLSRTLSTVLFPDPIGEALLDLGDEGLRLFLSTDAHWLARIPWEFVARPGEGPAQPWLKTGRVSMIRLESTGLTETPAVPCRTAIYLGAQATRSRLPALPLAAQADEFTHAFTNMHEAKTTTTASKSDLISALQTADVLHISAHGRAGQLLLDGHGGYEPVGAEALDELSGVRTRVAILSSCESSYQDPWHWTSIAAAFLDNGVEAVVAMPFRVEVESAQQFMTSVWESLARGELTSLAMAHGRQSIRDIAMCDWGIPVLYASGDPRLDVGLQHAPAEDLNQRGPGSLGNLPASITAEELVGRDRLLDALLLEAESHFDSPDFGGEPLHQVLMGMSGVGKSALAEVHAGALVKTGLAQLCWWIRAETPAAMSADLLALASHLQLAVRESESATFEQLRIHLETTDEPWVLVFDNADGSSDVTDVAPRYGRGLVVTTSTNTSAWTRILFRQRLIPVLSEQEAAARMLLDRTGHDDKETAMLIAERLGNLPIAIVCAAALITGHGYSFSEFVEHLDTSFEDTLTEAFTEAAENDLIPTGMRWLLHQVRTELSSSAQRLLETMSWLDPDAIPMAMLDSKAMKSAHGVSGRKSMSELRRQGLVTVDDSRIRLHRLIRSFVQQSQPGTAPPGLALAGECMLEMWPEDAETRAGEQAVELLLPHLRRLAESFDTHRLPGAGHLWTRVGRIYRRRGHLLDAQEVMAQASATHGDDLEVISENAHALYATDPGRSASLLSPLRARLLAADTPDALRTTALLAWHLRRTHPKDGRDLFDLVLTRYEQRGFGRTAALAEILSRRAELLTSIGDFDAAIDDYESAASILTRIEPDHPALVLVLTDTAIALRYRGDIDAATDAYRAAVDLAEARFGDRPHAALDSALNNLGFAKRIMGEYDESVELFRRALHMAEETKGPTSSAVALRQSNLGHSLALAGDLIEGLRYVDDGLKTAGDLDGSYGMAKRHEARARVLLLAGETDHAIEAFRTSIAEIANAGRESNAGDLASVQSQLAEALTLRSAQGDLDEAGTLLELADQDLVHVFGTKHYLYGEHLVRCGKHLCQQRDEAGARELWDRAAEVIRAAKGHTHPHVEAICRLIEAV